MVSQAGRRIIQVALFATGSCLYANTNILSQWSKSEDGSYAYSLPTVVLTAEAVKLLLACISFSAECGSPVAAWRRLASSPLMLWPAFVVPSALYSLNNNLDMLQNQHMDPATEQVLGQTKILTTGIVWWLVFREPMVARKWVSLVLLFLGSALAGLPSSALVEGLRAMYIDSTGVAMLTLYVWVSASAGVFNEWLYKGLGKEESVHACNIRLYTIGVLWNLGGHVLSSEAGELTLSNVYRGYNVYAWGLVLNFALLGVLLSQVMKWFNNIVKLFISGCSMYVSAVLSWTIFGYAPTVNFAAALVLVSGAMLLYNLERVFNLERISKTDKQA